MRNLRERSIVVAEQEDQPSTCVNQSVALKSFNFMNSIEALRSTLRRNVSIQYAITNDKLLFKLSFFKAISDS